MNQATESQLKPLGRITDSNFQVKHCIYLILYYLSEQSHMLISVSRPCWFWCSSFVCLYSSTSVPPHQNIVYRHLTAYSEWTFTFASTEQDKMPLLHLHRMEKFYASFSPQLKWTPLFSSVTTRPLVDDRHSIPASFALKIFIGIELKGHIATALVIEVNASLGPPGIYLVSTFLWPLILNTLCMSLYF